MKITRVILFAKTKTTIFPSFLRMCGRAQGGSCGDVWFVFWSRIGWLLVGWLVKEREERIKREKDITEISL